MYFQAADADDEREWVQVLLAQARLTRDAPITSVWAVNATLLAAIRAGGVDPFVAGQVTPRGPSDAPLAEYELGEVLGRGSFGQVLAAVHLPTGVKVAIKSLPKPVETDMRLQKVNVAGSGVTTLHRTCGGLVLTCLCMSVCCAAGAAW